MEHSNLIITDHGDVVDLPQLHQNILALINAYPSHEICRMLMETRVVLSSLAIEQGYPFELRELAKFSETLRSTFCRPAL